MTSPPPPNREVFGRYAAFYDSFYRDKDYAGEAAYTLRLARRHGVRAKPKILEIGCGTGGHLAPFVRAGSPVTGFDLSGEMLRRARAKLGALRREGLPAASSSRVLQGDARTYRDGATYGLVVSMFAVMGYLTSNEDFLAGLKTARAHLSPGGIFIFDVWHGPAVLSRGPEVRVHGLSGRRRGKRRTLRIVRPELDARRQVVRVRYDAIEIAGDRVTAEAQEEHTMRFFFVQELRFFLAQAGFALREVCPFLGQGREPGAEDWNISVVAGAAGGRRA